LTNIESTPKKASEIRWLFLFHGKESSQYFALADVIVNDQ